MKSLIFAAIKRGVYAQEMKTKSKLPIFGRLSLPLCLFLLVFAAQAKDKFCGMPAGGIYTRTPVPDDMPIALTFDDGPMRAHTPRVLDALAEHGIRATFFVSGHKIHRRSWHLIARMAKEGHALANHSWTHDTRMAIRQGTPEFHLQWLYAEIHLTQIKVDLALIAQDDADYTRLERYVFLDFYGKQPRAIQVKKAPHIYKRHEEIMREHGYAPGQHPVKLHWFRPPGGSPYLNPAKFPSADNCLFNDALSQADVRVALWHHSTRDSVPTIVSVEEKRHYAKLAAGAAQKHGGVILAHDRLIGRPLIALVKALVPLRDRLIVMSAPDSFTAPAADPAPPATEAAPSPTPHTDTPPHTAHTRDKTQR